MARIIETTNAVSICARSRLLKLSDDFAIVILLLRILMHCIIQKIQLGLAVGFGCVPGASVDVPRAGNL